MSKIPRAECLWRCQTSAVGTTRPRRPPASRSAYWGISTLSLVSLREMHFKEDEKRTKMWNMMVSLLHWNVAEYEPYITTRLITANDLSAVRPLILQLAIGELRQPASRKFGTIKTLRCRRGGGFKMASEPGGWHMNLGPPSWDPEAKMFSFFLHKRDQESVLCSVAVDALENAVQSSDLSEPALSP